MYDYARFYTLNGYEYITGARIKSYDLYLEPYGNRTSTVQVLGRLRFDEQNTLVLINDMLFLLNATTSYSAEETTNITLLPLYSIFDRRIPFTQKSNTLEQIAQDINTYFAECTDPKFRYAWLYVVTPASTTLPYTRPDVDETGRYNMREYLETVAENVLVKYNVYSASVRVSTSRRWFIPSDEAAPDEYYSSEKVQIYDTTITQDILVSATFAEDLISKVTHYDPDTGTSTDYYLLLDGTITTDGTAANRADGRWIVYSAPNANIGLVSAQFARSRYSHAIELIAGAYKGDDIVFVDRRFPNYYCKCKIKLRDGSVIDSRVTGINVRSGENEVSRITAGRALTKLNEIIQEVRNAYN